jgi:hypothetical protein
MKNKDKLEFRLVLYSSFSVVEMFILIFKNINIFIFMEREIN